MLKRLTEIYYVICGIVQKHYLLYCLLTLILTLIVVVYDRILYIDVKVNFTKYFLLKYLGNERIQRDKSIPSVMDQWEFNMILIREP